MTDEAIEGSLLSLLSSFRVEQVMNCYARGDWTGVYHTLVGVVNFGRVMEALGLGARGLFTNPVGQAFGAAARVAPILGAIITSVEIGVAIYNMLNDARIAAHTSRLCPIYGAGVLATRILGQPVPEQSIRSFTYERLEQRLRNENEAQNTRNFLLGQERQTDESREDIIAAVRENINTVHSRVDGAWSGVSQENRRLLHRFYTQQGLAPLWEEILGSILRGSRDSRAPLARSEFNNHFRAMASGQISAIIVHPG